MMAWGFPAGPSIMRRALLCGYVVLSTMAMQPTAAANEVSEATRAVRTVATVEQAAVALARAGAASDADAAQVQNLQDNIDFEAVASAILGAHWTTASDGERYEFLHVLRDLLVHEIVRRTAGRKAGSLEYLSHRSLANGDQLLSTRRLTPDATATVVDWRLREANSNLRIVDIIVNGISIVALVKLDFVGQLNLNDGSVAMLAVTLRDRLLRPF
jgi:phospholipid transport system substrate-binding protein